MGENYFDSCFTGSNANIHLTKSSNETGDVDLEDFDLVAQP